MSFAAEPYGVFVDDLVSALTGGVVREGSSSCPSSAPFRLGAGADVVAAPSARTGSPAARSPASRDGTDFAVDRDGDDRLARRRAGDAGARATWPDPGSTSTSATSAGPTRRRRRGSPTATRAASCARSPRASRASTPCSRASSRRLRRAASSTTADGPRPRPGRRARRRRAPQRGRSPPARSCFSRSHAGARRRLHPRGHAALHRRGPGGHRRDHRGRGRCARARCRSRRRSAALRRGRRPASRRPAALTVIHRPILGVEAVDQPAGRSASAAAAETDEALRRRAVRALEAAGRATVGAPSSARSTAVEGIREQDVADRRGPPRLPRASSRSRWPPTSTRPTSAARGRS